MGTWQNGIDSLLVDEWADAARISDEMLALLLDVARDQVIAYAPRKFQLLVSEVGVNVDIPESYVLAQIRQTQNLYRASVTDAGGQIGDGESFAITVFPLDWHVKQLIRPNRGAPRVR